MINQLNQLIDIIIVGYIFAFIMWFIMAAAHVSWGSKFSFAGIVFAFLWLFQAYRNYDFYITPGNSIDEKGVWMNVLFVLAVDACSFLLAWDYFPNLKNWIHRKFTNK